MYEPPLYPRNKLQTFFQWQQGGYGIWWDAQPNAYYRMTTSLLPSTNTKKQKAASLCYRANGMYSALFCTFLSLLIWKPFSRSLPLALLPCSEAQTRSNQVLVTTLYFPSHSLSVSLCPLWYPSVHLVASFLLSCHVWPVVFHVLLSQRLLFYSYGSHLAF